MAALKAVFILERSKIIAKHCCQQCNDGFSRGGLKDEVGRVWEEIKRKTLLNFDLTINYLYINKTSSIYKGYFNNTNINSF